MSASSHGNNCHLCGHGLYPQGGHCYMFKQEPEGRCMKYQPDRASLQQYLNSLDLPTQEEGK